MDLETGAVITPADGVPDFTYLTTFASLNDLGVWQIGCQVNDANRTECLTPLACDKQCIRQMQYSSFSFEVEVYNKPATTTGISHSGQLEVPGGIVLHANARDDDGGLLNYTWRVKSRPPASIAQLVGASSPDPQLPLQDERDTGTWEFEVDVDDDEGERATFSYSVVIPNRPPTISVAGPSTVSALQELRLTASATDPERGAVTVAWAIDEGPQTAPLSRRAPVANAGSGNTLSFVTTEGDITFRRTPWKFRATATDPRGQTATATHVVQVQNLRPTLMVSGETNLTVRMGPVFLRALASDPDGTPPTVTWTPTRQPLGGPSWPAGTGDTYSVAITSADVGDRTLIVTATDNEGERVTQTVQVRVADEEVCGDGIDNDNSGSVDDGCGAPPDDATCADLRGGPVDLRNGNMYLGPLTLAELRPPAGPPLRLSLSYNSRAVQSGRFGYGWTLDIDERVDVSGGVSTYFGSTGEGVPFDAPAAAALDESTTTVFPDPTLVSRARNGSNLGYFLSSVPVECPTGEVCILPVLPRVVFPDGSRSEFGSNGRLAARRDRYGNRQTLTESTAFDELSTLTSRFTLAQGLHAVLLDIRYRVSPPGPGPLLVPTEATASVRVGSAESAKVRLVREGDYLRAICAAGPAGTPGKACAFAGATNPCDRPGERTLYQFRYEAACQGPGFRCDPVQRLAEVMNESCHVVEKHAYQVTPLGVVAITSLTASETLAFDWTVSASHFPQPASVDVHSYLAPKVPPPGSKQDRIVTSTATFDTSVNRVATVDDRCGCGPSLSRDWDRDPLSGAPALDGFQQGGSTTTYLRRPAAAAVPVDPYGYFLPVRVSESDATRWATGNRDTKYAYLHPGLREATRTIEPGGRTTELDFDNDDPSLPCIAGLPRAPGSLAVPNERPTPYLCRITVTADHAVRTTRFQYDVQGRRVRVVLPGGDLLLYAYYPDNDADTRRAGRLWTSTHTDATGVLSLSSTFDDYDLLGNPRHVTTPAGETTLYDYDSLGRLTRVQAPDGAVTALSWASTGNPETMKLPRGGVVEYDYGSPQADTFGRLQAVRTKSASGSVLQELRHVYDLAGNVLVEERLDSTGAVVRRVQRDYDQAHRVIREVGPTGTTLSMTSWLHGRRHTVTDGRGVRTTFDYDGFGRLRHLSHGGLAGGAEVAAEDYLYDERDNLLSMSDGNKNTTTYEYDGFDQLAAVRSPNSGATFYAYTIDGLLASTATATHCLAGQRIAVSYDGLRRRKAETLEEYAGVNICNWPAGRLVSTTALATYTYDVGSHALGRLSGVEVPGALRRTLTYDNAGRPKDAVSTLHGLATPLTLTLAYHGGGALKSIAYPPQVPTGLPPLLEFDVRDDDDVTAVRFGGTTLASDVTHYPFGGGLRSFTRGSRNRIATTITQDLLGRRERVSGGPVDVAYRWTDGDVVDRTTETGDVARTRDWGYDALRRLRRAAFTNASGASVISETFDYDAAGNRTLKTRDSAKQFISVFDTKPGPGGAVVPANDLLRAVLDPSAAGQCVRPGSSGGNGNGIGNGNGNGNGNGPPACPGGNGVLNRNLAGIEADWKDVVRAAKDLARDAPALPATQVQNRLRSLLDQLRAWMTKYDVSAPALMAVLAGTHDGPVDFATTLTTYLQRRSGGVPLDASDMDLLKRLVNLAEKAQVRLAVELDPVWRYTHDANGAVTSVTLELPAMTVRPNGVELPITFGPVHNTSCYVYDTRQRLVRVESVSRVGAQVASPTPPCEDAARAATAEFRYDEASRRVYSKVAGIETWELRGAAGELLAEVSASGNVERAFVYLDGEPLAMVVLSAGAARRPPATPLGCASAEAVSASLVGMLALAVFLRRRRTRHAGLVGVVLVSVLLAQCGLEEPPPDTSISGAPGSEDAPPAAHGGSDARGGRAFGFPSHGNSAHGTLSGDPIYYFHNDALGTPIRLSDEDGRTVWRAEYRAFGEMQSVETDPDRDGVHVEQPIRFPGQYDDAISSLLFAQGPYFNWNRFYEPATGRYLAQEPLTRAPMYLRQMAESGYGVPAYAYALNNPVRYVDLNGLDPGVPYPDIETAVFDAQNYLYWRHSPDVAVHEWGGTFWQHPDGRVEYTAPETEGSTTQCSPGSFRPPPKPGLRAVGNYHNHPVLYPPSPNDETQYGVLAHWHQNQRWDGFVFNSWGHIYRDTATVYPGPMNGVGFQLSYLGGWWAPTW
ncbi:MAG: RHS domain-containing protein [Actinobacteria bacterium]|nr:RHS domain-containing protein [Actinomycetota bacterium]